MIDQEQPKGQEKKIFVDVSRVKRHSQSTKKDDQYESGNTVAAFEPESIEARDKEINFDSAYKSEPN